MANPPEFAPVAADLPGRTEFAALKYDVTLNVYDLYKGVNSCLMCCCCMGGFHSGLAVHGREFSFGRHDEDISGVFSYEPGRA